FDTPIRIKDAINIIPNVYGDIKSPVYNNSTLIISDDNNNRTQNDCAALCLNPDYLLPTTKIVSSLNCLRRVVLEQFWVTDGGYREDNEITVIDSNQTYNSQCDVMLTGSLVHELFQKIISRHNIQREDVLQIISGLIYRPSVVLQLYASGIEPKSLFTKLEEFIPKIFDWTQTHCIQHLPSHNSVTTVNQVKIKDVVAIEENIWSNRNVVLALLILASTSASDPPCSSTMLSRYVEVSISSRASPSSVVWLVFSVLYLRILPFPLYMLRPNATLAVFTCICWCI
ncbi:unnamed protein product, partial [Schistosoma mattheei]